MVKFRVLLLLGYLMSCRHVSTQSSSMSGLEARYVAPVADFLPVPKACDAFHSKEYRCDGYTQKNLPSGKGSANNTPEIETSTAPSSGFIGLQVLTPYDPERQSVIYIHGWNVEAPDHVFGLPDQWVQQAHRAGFNVFQWHWALLSFDDGRGCPGPAWLKLGYGNIPCNAAYAYFKEGGAVDLFLQDYWKFFQGPHKPVRLVFQSLAASFGIYASYRMYKNPEFSDVQKPNRLDVIDPFVMPGFGEERSVPYNGQIPPDQELPPDFLPYKVKDFVNGSSCTTASTILKKANALSQYCQTEGMAYHLIKEHNVGIIVFNSVVGGLTAKDFRRIAVHQSTALQAFGSDFTALHTTPNAAYFYSFAPGEPANGYDASTVDEVILRESRKKIAAPSTLSLLQTKGFDTIDWSDDAFVPDPS